MAMARPLRIEYPNAFYHVTARGYIHLNPVRAGVVETPEKYLWTSYNYCIGEKKGVPWLTTDWTMPGSGRVWKK